MKEVKALYHNGAIEFLEPVPETASDLGPVEVVVLFPEDDDDPWKEILAETTPRPSFVKFMQEAQEQIAQGQSEPLDLDQL